MASELETYDEIEARFVRAVQAIEQRIGLARRKSDVVDAAAWASLPHELSFEAPLTIADPVVRGLAIRMLTRQRFKPGRTSRQRGVTFVIDVPDVLLTEVVQPEVKLLEVAYSEYQAALLRRLGARAFPRAEAEGEAEAEAGGGEPSA